LWCQTPLLDISLDENETHLAEVDVYMAWSVCADSGEEVLGLEAVCDVVKLLAVSSEKEGSGSRSVSDADDISLDVCGTVGRGLEGLVVSAVSVGHVGYRGFVVPYNVSVCETMERSDGTHLAA
jgi:hypothetical protein